MYTNHPNHIEREDGVCFARNEVNVEYREYLAWVAAGNTPDEAPSPSLEQRALMLLAGVDEHLNAAARAKGYDSIITASLRAALPASPFHAEGVAFGTWMDAVYAKCYEVLAQVKADEIAEPTTDELLAMLPALQLPT
ncbi:hypothetical protein [Variovorax sp. R-27]|uniref:hypothetical protein n=1 Tax=Variovorax sp. R-27 TaxID=3404058 RepID=UPI003CE8E62C